jgi:hypothetical protein
MDCQLVYIATTHIIMNITIEGDPHSFLSKNRDKHTDLEIHMGDKILKVHKWVLASRSPVLEAMIFGKFNDNKENVLTLDPEVYDIDAFDLMIQIIYDITVVVNDMSLLVRVINIIDYCSIDTLYAKLSPLITNKLTTKNCYDVYKIVTNSQIKTACMTVILGLLSLELINNELLASITDSYDMKTFIETYIDSKFYNRDDASRIHIVKVLLEWSKIHKIKDNEFIKSIVVNIKNLPTDFIINVIIPHKIFDDATLLKMLIGRLEENYTLEQTVAGGKITSISITPEGANLLLRNSFVGNYFVKGSFMVVRKN